VANSEVLVVDRGVSKRDARGSLEGSTRLAMDLLALTKPRITGLVLLTGAAGAALAPRRAGFWTLTLAFAGTALIVGAANALNMWLERDVDARMSRTKNRPLPAGRVSPDLALACGLALAAASIPMLFAVNVATGSLGLAALVTYVAIYTPLKRRTDLALLVGAVPGAIPPVLGWTSETGGIGLGGLLLFGLLFFWQLPHFAAISIARADDYARANLKVVSTQRGERAARWIVLGWSVLLVVSSLLFVPFGLAGRRYAAVAGVLALPCLGLAALGLAASAHRDARRWAMRVFRFSIVHLTFLIVALLCDSAAP
jgi:protoheme IX farnesyltransferase